MSHWLYMQSFPKSSQERLYQMLLHQIFEHILSFNTSICFQKHEYSQVMVFFPVMRLYGVLPLFFYECSVLNIACSTNSFSPIIFKKFSIQAHCPCSFKKIYVLLFYNTILLSGPWCRKLLWNVILLAKYLKNNISELNSITTS